ncbi:MAG: carbonic anhydrase [Acidobacteria bacterium]|nr:carbonic anhydrase [Acidobacteriota bacterium]
MLRSFLILCIAALPLAAQTSNTDANDPDALWKELQGANLVYQGGTISWNDLRQQRAATDVEDGQHPPVAILSCADSRVPPELIFKRDLAKIFVVRDAGNVASNYDLASLEYAVSKGWTRLIIVMGHSRCGAVEAALAGDDNKLTPSLVELTQRIRESFGSNWATPPSLEDATKRNARASAAWLPAHSALIRNAVRSGRVKILAAYYNLGSGAVEEVR